MSSDVEARLREAAKALADAWHDRDGIGAGRPGTCLACDVDVVLTDIAPSDSLDAAWRAAEEALPPNRDLVVGRWPDTETTVRYFARAVVPGAPVGYGPNLAAALLDLAARLKEADHG